LTTGEERRRTRMHGWQGEPESHRLQPPALNSASSGSVAAGKTQPLSSARIYPLIGHLSATHWPDYDVARIALSAQSTHDHAVRGWPPYGLLGR